MVEFVQVRGRLVQGPKGPAVKPGGFSYPRDSEAVCVGGRNTFDDIGPYVPPLELLRGRLGVEVLGSNKHRISYL